MKKALKYELSHNYKPAAQCPYCAQWDEVGDADFALRATWCSHCDERYRADRIEFLKQVGSEISKIKTVETPTKTEAVKPEVKPGYKPDFIDAALIILVIFAAPALAAQLGVWYVDGLKFWHASESPIWQLPIYVIWPISPYLFWELWTMLKEECDR